MPPQPTFPPKTLVTVVGPTAVGKTRLSIALAQAWHTQIVNCDARQVYRQLDIGTAKPTLEEQSKAPHHLLNHLDIVEPYNAQQYTLDALEVLDTLFTGHDIVVAVGGSTLYAQTLWYGLDEIPPVKPEIRAQLWETYEKEGLTALLANLQEVDPSTASRIDTQNPARVLRALEVFHSSGKPISFFQTGNKKERPWRNIKIALNWEPRSELYERINLRVEAMMEAGLESELKQLLAEGIPADAPGLQTIGYRELLPYLAGRASREEAVSLIQRNSRRYAKRQLTWWRKEPDIVWLDAKRPLAELIVEVNTQVQLSWDA